MADIKFEPLTGGFTPQTTAEAPPIPKGFWTNAYYGAMSALDVNTIKMISDISNADPELRDTDLLVPQEIYKPGFNYYNENIDWSPDLTFRQLQIAADHDDWARRQAYVAENSSGLARTGYWGSLLATSIFADPINYVPIPFVGLGGSTLAKMAIVGAGGGLLQAGITPLYKKGYEARGVDYGVDDAITDVALTAIASAALYGVGAKGVQLWRASRTPISDTARNEIIAQRKDIKEPTGYQFSPEAGQLIKTGGIQFSRSAFDNTSTNFIKNIKVAHDSGPIWVDTNGNVSATKIDNSVKVEFNANGEAVLSGQKNNIVRVFESVDDVTIFPTEIAPNKRTYKLLSTDEAFELDVNKLNVKKAVSKLEQETNTTSGLTPLFRSNQVTIDNIRTEFELKNNKLVEYKIVNGKKTQLDDATTKSLIKTVINDPTQQIKARSNDAQSSIHDDGSQPNSFRSGNQSIEQIQTRTKNNLKLMDDESAVKNSMGKLFEAHIDDVQNTQIGIFAMRSVPDTKLKRLGYRRDKITGLLTDTTPTGKKLKVATGDKGPLTEIELEQKRIIQEILNNDANARAVPEAQEELAACVLGKAIS